MSDLSVLHDPELFSQKLYERMSCVQPGVADLELYEFRYCLDNFVPKAGWHSLRLEPTEIIEQRISQRSFFESIQIKPRVEGKIALDATIQRLTQCLFAGLAAGFYSVDWVRKLFYFDLRGFYFLVRTQYFTPAVLAHLGGQPYRSFEPRQAAFEVHQSVGYAEFKAANAEVDQAFIECVLKLTDAKGTPLVLAIAGGTAAGKTEIVARLNEAFHAAGRETTSIEMDHFLTDRDEREAKGIDSLGGAAIHRGLFKICLEDIRAGKAIRTPRYDFITGTSSHTLEGALKPGKSPIEIAPADIIFIEGNFPFLLPETNDLIGIKVVYLTDDPVRLKRKWKRDMDYRMKYDLNYFRNRYFKDQFLMAQDCFLPQMEACDLLVDTTGARLWATPETATILG